MASKQLSPNTLEAKVQERNMRLRDGGELFFRAWEPPQNSRKAVLFLHRGHEHSGRLFDAIKKLNFDDTWVFAWDARGHGRTKGELISFKQLVDDLNEFITHISTTFEIGINDISIVAQSFSAIVAAAWAQEYGQEISSLVLIAPAFKINLFFPGAYQFLRALVQIAPNAQVPSYVSGRWLTRDKIQASLYDHDPSITRHIRASVLVELRRAAANLVDTASSISVPTMLLIPEQDFIVSRREQIEFFSKLRSTRKEILSYPGMRHDMIHDSESEKPLREVRKFVLENLRQEIHLH